MSMLDTFACCSDRAPYTERPGQKVSRWKNEDQDFRTNQRDYTFSQRLDFLKTRMSEVIADFPAAKEYYSILFQSPLSIEKPTTWYELSPCLYKPILKKLTEGLEDSDELMTRSSSFTEKRYGNRLLDCLISNA